MASDDAADLLLEIDQDRRLPILNLLPAAKQRKIKACSATTLDGGRADEPRLLVSADATAGEALDRVRASELGPQQLSIVCVVDEAAGRCAVARRPRAR